MAERNIHKEFQKAMQESWEEYVIDPSQLTDEEIPKPDLSFLDQLSEEDSAKQDTSLHFPASKKNHRRSRRFTTVAAAVLAIFILSSAIGIFVNSEASYGIKSFVQNIRHLASENEPEVNENGAKTLSITDWDKINNGKKVVGTLYLPTYIPKGYTFQEANFSDASGGRGDLVNTTYTYSSEEKSLMLSIWKITSDTETSVIGELDQSPISGRDMYVDQNKERGEYVITYVEEDMGCSVIAPTSKYDAFKIIEGIEKQEH